MKRTYVPYGERGGDIGFRHVYSMDTHKCLACGQKKPVTKRKPPIVLAMTLYKGWRIIATPLTYKVQRLRPCHHSPGGNPVWTKVQTMPRTRNAWVDQEFDCAMAMFERCFMKHAAVGDIDHNTNTEPYDIQGYHSIMAVKQQLVGLARWKYCYFVLRPEWLTAMWWQQHYYRLRWKCAGAFMGRR